MYTLVTARRVLYSALVALPLAACAGAHMGASDADLESARSQSMHGGTLFHEQCATCHGERGEGRGEAPSILGEGALPRYQCTGSLDAYATHPGLQHAPAGGTAAGGRPELASALDLHGYLVGHMPQVAQGKRLSSDDYWAVVKFMLLAHGADVPDEGIAGANAASVKIERQRP
jgi:mono/diheme cytochrome c family protein